MTEKLCEAGEEFTSAGREPSMAEQLYMLVIGLGEHLFGRGGTLLQLRSFLWGGGFMAE